MNASQINGRFPGHGLLIVLCICQVALTSCGNDKSPKNSADSGPDCLGALCDAGEMARDAALPDATVPDGSFVRDSSNPDSGRTPCEPGTYLADQECLACEGDTYSSTEDATVCESWSTCEPGTYVSVPGSSTSDRVCDGCTSGTFSASEDAEICETWSECELGYLEAVPGSSSADRTCAFDEWTLQFGENAYVLSIATAPSGHIVVSGYTSGTLPGEKNLGGSDAFVRVFDAAGSIVWTRQFGTNQDERGESVAVDSNGNIAVVGFTRGLLPGQLDDGGTDAFVRVYDSTGVEKWTRQFGSGSGDSAVAVAVGPNDTFLVGGYTNGAFPGQAYAGKSDAFLRSYDSAGKELWTREFGSTGSELVDDIAVDSAGNVAVVGITDSTIPGEISLGDRDGYVRVYNSSGLEQWTHQFGSSAYDRATAVAADSNGNFAIGGYTEGALPGQSAWGGVDSFVRLYSGIGAELWTKQFGTDSSDELLEVDDSPNGNIVVTGRTGGAFTGHVAAGGTDGFVRIYDVSGLDTWTKQFGTMGDEICYGITSDKNSNLTCGGFTNGTFPSQTGGHSFLARFAAQ